MRKTNQMKFLILFLILLGGLGLGIHSQVIQLPQLKIGTEMAQPENPLEDTPVINKETEIWLIKEYACGEEERVPLEPDKRLIGLSLEDLRATFNEDLGWSMEEVSQGQLAFRQVSSSLCEKHRKKRFITLIGKEIAVYEGTFDQQGALIQKTNIDKEVLPVELQVVLDQSRSYENLSEKLKTNIRDVLEFENDSEVNYFLDTLDEYIADE